MRSRWFTLIAVTLLTINIANPSFAVSSTRYLILEIHPYKSPSKLIKAYSPLANYLSQAIGRIVEVRIAKNYQSHIDAIGNNKVDIAFMGPASYVKLVDQYQQKPILACLVIHGKKTFQGKIITRIDSGINSLSQLKGKRFAFGDKESTMSHLVPRFLLYQAGIDVRQLKKFAFLGSHDNVALAVLAGDYDAGAVKEEVFYKYQQRGLKSIKDTPKLTEHVFVTRSDLDPNLIKQLKAALLHAQDAPNAKSMLTSIKKGLTGFADVKDSDYDTLRHILSRLKTLGVDL